LNTYTTHRARRTLFLPSVGIALLIKLVIDRVLATSNGDARASTVASRSAVGGAGRGGVGAAAGGAGSAAAAARFNSATASDGVGTAGGFTLALAVAVVAACAHRTVVRNEDWKSNEVIFRAGHEAYPRSVKLLYMTASTETNGLRAQEMCRKAVEIYPFHCYCLAMLTSYKAHSAYRDIDASVGYAERAGGGGACYFGRGKAYLSSVLSKELVPLLESDAASPSLPVATRCKRLEQLVRLHALEQWDEASNKAAALLEAKRRDIGCQ
jgi:hypothetical protein